MPYLTPFYLQVCFLWLVRSHRCGIHQLTLGDTVLKFPGLLRHFSWPSFCSPSSRVFSWSLLLPTSAIILSQRQQTNTLAPHIPLLHAEQKASILSSRGFYKGTVLNGLDLRESLVLQPQGSPALGCLAETGTLQPPNFKVLLSVPPSWRCMVLGYSCFVLLLSKY